ALRAEVARQIGEGLLDAPRLFVGHGDGACGRARGRWRENMSALARATRNATVATVERDDRPSFRTPAFGLLVAHMVEAKAMHELSDPRAELGQRLLARGAAFEL